VETLKHELMDYMLSSRPVEPLVALINLLIKFNEARIYREEENPVETFSKII
jgi:hypothetical protein